MEARQLRAILSAALDRPVSDLELSSLSRYLDLISRWNRVHSLTGLKSEQAIAEGLIADSFRFLSALPPGPIRVMDLGSGAGIPGIPLKVARPEIDLVLVEARRKRASFLSTAIRELELNRALVVAERGEELLERAPSERGAFDAVVARSAGRPDQVRALAFHFLRTGGVLVLGGSAQPERGRARQTAEFETLTTPGSGRAGGRTLLVAYKPS
jgi:16S rRNA (guanine527-N7)-methyltransferase